MRPPSWLAIVLVACAGRPPAPVSVPAPTPPRAPPAAVVAEAPPHETVRPTVCPARHPIGVLAFSPDGAWMATAMGLGCREASDTSVEIRDLHTGAVARTLDAKLACARLEWTAEGLETNANPDTGMSHITLWAPRTFEPRVDLDYYLASSLAFDAKGERAVTATAQGQVAMFDLRTGHRVDRPEKEAHLGGDYSVGASFSADGKSVLLEDQGDGLALLSPSTLKRMPGVAQHRRMLGGSSTSPSKALVAVVEEPGNLEIYRTRDLSRLRTLEHDKTGTTQIAGWIDDEHLLTIADGGVIAWDLRGHATTIVPASGASPRCASSASVGDAGRFAVGRPDCSVSVMQGPEAKELWRFDAPAAAARPAADPPSLEPATTITWSPRGERAVLTLPDGTISIRDATTGKALASLAMPSPEAIEASAWSPDESIFAVAAGSLTLLRVADGRRVDVATFDADGARSTITLRDDGAFTGARDLVPCAYLASGLPKPAGTTLREDPAIFEDLFARRSAGRAR